MRTMSSTLTSVNRKSLVAEVIDALRGKVNDGTWLPGHRIPPETMLAEQLGIGRNTLRQAIGVLAQSELLEVRQGDGTYVRRAVDPAETMEKLNAATLKDHLELHRTLEGEAARLAALRRTSADLDALHKLLVLRKDYAEQKDTDGFNRHDKAFHLRVAEASHNSALFELYRYFASTSEARVQAFSQQGTILELDHAAHEALLNAIEQRNSVAAMAAAQALFEPLLTALSLSKPA